ncbi:MAG TPA: DUF4192 domain-containing protein [Dermatophilaceae bacterium]|nr:DUF4192 domain-containing protein [Dermatophilaceae bacterium]
MPLPFVCSPADLLAVVPYQLGFYPRASVVIVCLDAADRVVGMIRIDTGPLPPPPGSAEVAAVAALLRRQAGGLVILGFEEAQGSSDAVRCWLARLAADGGVAVVAHLVVRDGRWWDVECVDPTCCPAPGRPVPPPARVSVVAEWVGRGVAPLADRAAVARQLDSGPRAAEVAVALSRQRSPYQARAHSSAHPGDRPPDGDGAAAPAWEAILDPGGRHPPVRALPAHLLAAAALALQGTEHRDAVICWLAPDLVPPDLAPPDRGCSPLSRMLGEPPWAQRHGTRDATTVIGPASTAARSGYPLPTATAPVDMPAQVLRCQHRLIDLVACLPRDEQVVALSVLASFAWWRGDGPLAAVALERAVTIDPGDSLSGVLLRMVRLGVRPWATG